ncbi:uncharacterized protein BDZ99DRAFT_526766 [Mytilinidion resinicola]|uniref:MARVEL domain-containing protein n=1 Tax=Mytilinidion resinicola TaxID=574789 RepID=A0A6A6Y5W2_9PEZI|nr:uncharacterized protein BDZ99DRAFT_526766 [Mytilinidion resinicola]KAF2803414.1 hypothetical protein BDZ99DRAFT_526766 [Mytilinidion resinicola]
MPPSAQNTSNYTLALRNATIVAFPPGFLLGLIHGIISNDLFPALSSVPLFGSAVLALAIHPTLRSKLTYGGSPITLSPTNVLALDFLLGFFHLLFLILAWVNVPQSWDGGRVMLGTYATVPGFICVAVHGWFVARDVGRVVQHSRQCEECAAGMAGHGEGRHGRGGEYTPLTVGEDYEEVEEGRVGV